MKKYVEAMLALIAQQIVPGRTNLIRIEGVEHPAVYQAICKALNARYAGDLHAALSGEKYAQFKAAQSADSQVLPWFEANGLVLRRDTLTWMRNQAANEPADKTSVYLLMGAEAVQDRGGLEDFTSIMTSELAKQLSADYSAWFKGLFDAHGFDPAHLKTIHAIYRALFSAILVDTMQLSCFVDALQDMVFDAPEEVVGVIYNTLDRYWHIPRIEKRLRLDVESKSDLTLLHSAIGFIQRKDSILKRLQSKKLEQQLSDYAENNGIDADAAFPADSPCFPSFAAFAAALTDFGAGKNQAALKSKFTAMDYSIIADILGVRIESTSTPKKGTVSLHGDPLEAYGHLIFDAAEKYRRERDACPNTIEIAVTEIRLSQCTAAEAQDGDTSSIAAAYAELTSALGGIVAFLNEAHFASAESELKISYFDGVDPFTMQAYGDQFFALAKTTRNWDDMCHID